MANRFRMRGQANTTARLVWKEDIEMAVSLSGPPPKMLRSSRLCIEPKLARYPGGPVAALVLTVARGADRRPLAAALLNPTRTHDLKLLKQLSRQDVLQVNLLDEQGNHRAGYSIPITPIDRLRLEALLRAAARAAAAVPLDRRDFARSCAQFTEEYL